MKVTSDIPYLLVTHPRVQFVDGAADVDAGAAELLRNLEWCGVHVPEPSDDKPDETPEKKTAKKTAKRS